MKQAQNKACFFFVFVLNYFLSERARLNEILLPDKKISAVSRERGKAEVTYFWR